MMIILLVGFDCTKSLSQSHTPADSTAIEDLLEELKQMKDSNLKSAFEFSKVIQQKAYQRSYQPGGWKARIEQGIIYNRLGHPDSSRSIISKVLKEAQEQGNCIIAIKAHLGLTFTFQQTADFPSAVDQLIQAEKLLKKEDPFDLRFEILNNLGIVHRAMKDFPTAMKYFNLIESQYLEQLNQQQKFSLFMNKGNVFADQKEYNKTEELFKKAYEQIKQENSPANQATITYNLGALYYRQKRLAEAEEYIKKALEANVKIGNPAKIERCYRVLGSIYFDQKDYLKAIKFHHTALEIAQSIKNPNSIMGNYKNLYLAHWGLGFYNRNFSNMDKALEYYQKYNGVKDSLYQIETTAKILEFEKQYETEKKNSQIALLEKENQHHEDQILIQKTERNYLMLIIFLVTGTLLVFVYFFYYYKKVNQLLKVQSKSILEQKNQISEQNNQLQKLLNTRNKLFSIIAHDLRSPLVSIFNISQLVGFYIEDKEYEALGETVMLLDQKTNQILDLTDNLLNWSKSQTGNFQPLWESLSLNEIFEECLELYRPIAVNKNITIECEEQKDLLIWADRNMVKTICRNLVNNAIKFTHKNGHIKVWHEPGDQIVRISVKDSGIGIDPTNVDRLFEIGDEKITAGTEGERSTGLGLSVCKEFADAMKGKIWVESQPGIGSHFTFELLLYDPNIHLSNIHSSQQLIPFAELSCPETGQN